MFLTLITACENHANFLTCIVQFDWLISNQIQFDCSVLFFPIENSSNKSTKSSSFFILLFDIFGNNEINETFLKKATVGIGWEILCSNRDTGRFDEKFGDSRQDHESCRVCKHGHYLVCHLGYFYPELEIS